jgi:hypothetical protein
MHSIKYTTITHQLRGMEEKGSEKERERERETNMRNRLATSISKENRK